MEEEKRNNPLYGMTEERALQILKNAYPDYQYLNSAGIAEEVYNFNTGVTGPAYQFTFFKEGTNDIYVGWVFGDGKFIFKHEGTRNE